MSLTQAQTGIYFQDDYRARKELTLSAGVRGEFQSHVGGFHLGPRGGLAWSPLKSGKATVRAGGGMFFDWFDALSYQQAIQLDGSHQQIETIVAPGYPNASIGGQSLLLPNGRVQHRTRPRAAEALRDQRRPRARTARLVSAECDVHPPPRLEHLARRQRQRAGRERCATGSHGRAPSPTSRSTASSSFDGLSINFNYMNPQRRMFLAANYFLSRSINEGDGPFSLAADASNLAAERGPALGDARHRVMGFMNMPLWGRRLSFGSSIRVQSALPYNITTGRDDNGDTISNDRPSGVTRNSGRGSALVDLSTRLAWRLAFGGAGTGGTGRSTDPHPPRRRRQQSARRYAVGRRHQAIRDRALRAGVQPAEPRERHDVQWRGDVAVLRAGHGRGAAAPGGSGCALLVLRGPAKAGRHAPKGFPGIRGVRL